MKKSISLLIIAIIALTSSINANAWTDRNTFNLKGPVKAVYDETYANSNLYFEEDGTYIPPGDEYTETLPDVSRNSAGKIESLTNAGALWYIEYKYNKKGQVIKTERWDGNSSFTKTSYTYNAKGQVIKEIIKSGFSDVRGSKVVCTDVITYTYQKFDSYGNWIKRTAKVGRKSTVETRTITYY